MLSGILLIIAFALFVLAALPNAPVKLPFSLVPAGLACMTLAQILASGIL
jgi:hypothetical protein